jgi:glucokinase
MGRKVMSDGKGRVISKLAHGNLKEVNPRLLAIAAGEGDATAKQIWKDAGEKLGIVLASVIDLLNPEMIVIAGGVSKAGNLLLNPIKDTVKDRAFKTPAKACKIVISKYTQKLGVVGAALLVK